MKCIKCGREITSDSLFCEYCGEHLGKSPIECKVHVKWLLYVAMLFTCILNYYIFDVTYTHELGAALCPLLVQLGIFISVSFLRYKKRITTSMFLLTFFMLLCNILFVVEVLIFDGYPDYSNLEYNYYNYGYYYHDSYILIFISPLMLFLSMIYDFYSLSKSKN